jgi:hypothetical protein
MIQKRKKYHKEKQRHRTASSTPTQLTHQNNTNSHQPKAILKTALEIDTTTN